jgi:hypothetical protein
VLLYCHAGCPIQRVVEAVGFEIRELFEINQVGDPIVASYDYQDADGQLLYQVVRFEPKGFAQRRPNRAGGWTWNLNGVRRVPYRLPEVLHSVAEGRPIYIAEGEKDVHAIERAGVVATTNPGGAGKWLDEYSAHFAGAVVTVVADRDALGMKHAREVAASIRRAGAGRVRVVSPPEAHDISEHLAAGRTLHDLEAMPEERHTALEAWRSGQFGLEDTSAGNAVPLAAGTSACPELATLPRILDRFASEIEAAGVVGESRVVKLLYLCLTTRFFDRLVSVALKGPSSGGKSYVLEEVLRFFPDNAYYSLTGMSERALAYLQEPLSHRYIVVYEAVGLEGDFASYLMRSLLSEGRLLYETVEKTKEGLRSRRIEKEGPTGLLLTTTAVRLHPENETRLLSLLVTDTRVQTKMILLAQARGVGQVVDLAPWHQLQEWIERGPHGAMIPYGEVLAKLVPPVAVRLRRDFPTVLALIKAHAVLHQASRVRDSSGSVVATLEDYAAVRDLVADLVAEGVEATVSPTVRATVMAVGDLAADTAQGVTVKQVATSLQLDKSAASRRVKHATAAGYLRNLEERRGAPARLVLGDPLPEETDVLPSVERLQERLQEG